ncbi:T9SS type A sorting domain-containing protein [Ekhidna sp.]|uniref:T9SS type A sorting domain-containing protein n=1 Tax=Ekhidna sp. TaxID=2608089 RepID=UPI003CCBF5E1
MKTHYLAFSFLAILCFNSYSQCKTYGSDSDKFIANPWYGNNQYLTDYLTDRGYIGDGSNYRTSCPGPRYQLPVRMVVFRNGSNSSSSAINQIQAESYLQGANQMFEDAGTGIHFYLEQFEFIADNQAHSGIDGLLDTSNDPNFFSSIELFLRDRVDGMINIYFVKNTSSSETATGTATVPFSNQIPAEFPGALWSCWVKTHNGSSFRGEDNIVNTLAHELGHVLGNVHTHHPGSLSIFNPNFDSDNAEQSACFQEVVSRTQTTNCIGNPSGKKCEVNGDGLCDTAADPNSATERSGSVLLKGVSNAPGCVYSVPNYDNRYKRDRNNVLWNPPVHNIMSYANNTCQDEFSNGQIAIMWDRIETRFKDYFQGDFTAPSLICTNGGTVTINNSPPNMNISWTATPSYLFHSTTRSGLGTSAFVKAKDSSVSGWGTISFHEGDNCDFFSSSYKVWIGKPSIPSDITIVSPQWNSQNQTCPNTILELVVNDQNNQANITNYNWSIQGASLLSGQGTESVFVKIPNHFGTRYLTFSVRAQNSCGYSSYNSLYGTSNSNYGGCGDGGGGPMLLMYPNPSSGEFDLNFSNPDEMEDYVRVTNTTVQVTISDLMGEKVFHGVINKNGLHVNLKNSKKGMYLVTLSGKGLEEKATLIIE